MNSEPTLSNITNCSRLSSRITKEWRTLETQPPLGVKCTAKNDKINEIAVEMMGSKGSPYEGGVFQLEIQISDRYPMVPPSIHFITPIYHPNIDDKGRICLDILKMPPEGAWRPSIQLRSVLCALQELLAEPNPDDPLMAPIAQEYKYHREVFNHKARDWTKLHALPKSSIMMSGCDQTKETKADCSSRETSLGPASHRSASARTAEHRDSSSSSSDSDSDEDASPPSKKKCC